jgi:DNA-binding beta-propeller fold protein YncE
VTRTIHRTIATLTLLLSATALLALPVSALAAEEAPVKEIVSSHFGWDVNRTKVQAGAPQAERNVCTVLSKDDCQFGVQSSQAGGFLYPEGLAVNNAPALVSPEHGDVYVSDKGHNRVQVFSPAGAFVEMFGWDVNKTRAGEGAPQAERNLCTAISGDVCQAGVEGGAAGQFAQPKSLAVDPATGNVYVEDFANWRVQEFTAAGAFILTIGKGVDQTTKGNLCTAASKDTCKAGERAAAGSKELGAFNFDQSSRQDLAIGGPEGLLYVGDEYRVQILKTDGTPFGEISLTSISSAPNSTVGSVAVDAAGDVYVAYQIEFVLDTVYEFDPSAKEIKRFEFDPRRPEATAVELEVAAIALDPAGRLAVSEREHGYVEGHHFVANRGGLYVVGPSLLLLTEFNNQVPSEFGETYIVDSIGFNANDEMYAVSASANEVVSYTPVPVAALSVKVAECKAGANNETDATAECSLKGQVNPWGVLETDVWFQWGRTPALGLETPRQPVATGAPAEVSAPLTGLLPNKTYYYRLVGEDQNVKSPELLASARTSVTTAPVAPRIVGEPSVLHEGPFSAVLFGELNPENSSTEYSFRYWPCESTESCPEVEAAETQAAQSPTYGAIGTTVEAGGLRPGTLYHYRLLAKSQGGEAASQAGAFTTTPEPAVSAQTGGASTIATTSALVSGTVNPDGQASSYAFELGRYNGAQTYLGIVSSGSAGAGYRPVPETLALSGLQPGTTYAYRIAAHSGDGSKAGEAATGATLTFTTQGLPAVLISPTPLPMLAVPGIAFPTAVTSKSTTKALTNAQKLAKALTACKKKAKRQRAACQKQARKKYPKSKQANNRKKG